MKATNPDNELSPITYSVEGALAEGEFDGQFVINSTGHVWLTRPVSRDYPYGHATWTFNVAGEDDGIPKKKGYGTVSLSPTDINDNAPIFDTCCLRGSIMEGINAGECLQSVWVASSLPTHLLLNPSSAGSPVMTIEAVDYDFGVNAEVTFEAVEIPEENGQPVFVLNPTTGEITSGVRFDREAKAVYTMVVKARDGGSTPQISSQLNSIATGAYQDSSLSPLPSLVFLSHLNHLTLPQVIRPL